MTSAIPVQKTKQNQAKPSNFGFVARFLSNSCPSQSTNQSAAFLQPATNVFVAGQVDQAMWKTGKIDQTCNETMLRDKLRVFVSRISPPLVKYCGRLFYREPRGSEFYVFCRDWAITVNFSYFCLELKAFVTFSTSRFFYIATRNEKIEITMMNVKCKIKI